MCTGKGGLSWSGSFLTNNTCLWKGNTDFWWRANSLCYDRRTTVHIQITIEDCPWSNSIVNGTIFLQMEKKHCILNLYVNQFSTIAVEIEKRLYHKAESHTILELFLDFWNSKQVFSFFFMTVLCLKNYLFSFHLKWRWGNRKILDFLYLSFHFSPNACNMSWSEAMSLELNLYLQSGGLKHLSRRLLPSREYEQEVGLEVVQPGFNQVLLRDAGISNSILTLEPNAGSYQWLFLFVCFWLFCLFFPPEVKTSFLQLFR